MTNIVQLLTEHMDIWTAADTEKKSGRGRSRGNPCNVYGIKKLRELILELAVRGKLVSQDSNDEPANELLKRIQVEKAKLMAEGKLKKEKLPTTISEEEKSFEIPDNWVYARVNDTGQYINGLAFKPNEWGNVGLPIIRIQNLSGRNLDFNRTQKVVDDSVVVRSGDILVSWSATLDVFTWDLDELGVLNQHIFRVIPEKLIEKNYLFWLLKAAIREMEDSVHAHGLVMTHINRGPFLSHVIGLPPLAEQHRIVAKVDELMKLCNQLEQQHSNAQEAHETLVSQLLATLTQSQNAAEFNANWQRIYSRFDVLFTTEASIDALKQTLLQLAVMGKLVPQDPNDEPVSELLKSILTERDSLIKNEGLKTVAKEEINQQEMYIQVPNSWAYCRLGNLAKFIDYRGRTPNKVTSGIPLITAKNVRQGYISREPEEYVTPEEYKTWMTRGFPRAGDMLFTTEAPLGNIALIDITEKFALAQRVICFQLHNQSIGNYLQVALMSYQVQQQFENSATGMTATGIKSSKLKEIPVPIPPLAEQHRIVTKVDALMALCDQLKTRIQQANQQQQVIADALVEQAVA